MKTRLSMKHVQADAYKAMDALEKFIANSSITKLHRELIKIRASQINNCPYCLDLHNRDARKLGETEQRLYVLSAWKEAEHLFTEEERVLLRMTEEVTLIHQDGLSDEVYEQALNVFGEEQTAQIIMAIITINAWNRIAITTKMKVPVAAKEQENLILN